MQVQDCWMCYRECSARSGCSIACRLGAFLLSCGGGGLIVQAACAECRVTEYLVHDGLDWLERIWAFLWLRLNSSLE